MIMMVLKMIVNNVTIHVNLVKIIINVYIVMIQITEFSINFPIPVFVK